MGKIPNFMASEQLKTPKMDCALIVYKDKEFYHFGFQVCWPWNTGERATLMQLEGSEAMFSTS